MGEVRGSSQPASVPGCSARTAESAAAPEVRVNQVGYASQSPKVAFAMLPRRVRSVS
jgi:hypothetical protein